LGDAGYCAAGEILSGDYYKLHGVVRGVDWKFVGRGIYVRGGGAGECDCWRNVAGYDYCAWGFLYGYYHSDLGGGVGRIWSLIVGRKQIPHG